MTDPLDEIYREIILDHYRAPRGKKPLEKSDLSSNGHNPSCGDDIDLHLLMDNGTVKDINVNCKGCAISVASGSMLAEYIKGKSLNEVKKIADVVKKMLKGEEFDITKEIGDKDLGDIDSLKGVRQFPVRIKCALLAWMTLIEGLKNYEDGKKVQNPTTTEKDSE